MRGRRRPDRRRRRPARPDSGAVGRRGRRWRAAAVTVALAALLHGTVRGTDDHFPFGPFVMYAFSVASDGEIRSTRLEADTAEGERVRVSLTPGAVGLRRAEIEGQLATIEANPSLLQAVAVAHRRLNPRGPAYVRLHVVVDVTTLRDGVAVGRTTQTVASWDVR